MQDNFIGRTQELALLEQAYSSKASAFVPIYGRRRIGKTELILHFLRDKVGVYYLGKQARPAQQRREFLQVAAVSLQEPLLASYPAENWGQVLRAVAERWQKSEKLIVALDEFQWIAQSSPELPSLLQELWDRGWKSNGKIVLILSGSYVGFMEREVLGRKSPLFGRRTAQILLKPFGYREAAGFHPRYSIADQARTYFLCGGVPLYLKCFSDQQSVESNVVANLLSEFAPLYHEPDFLLREELREVENHYAVLMAVAAGFSTSRSLAEKACLDARILHYYLHQLTELGYLVRRYPLSSRPPAQRHVHYVVDDPLLRFWFRFVYPNTSLISQLGGERVFRDRIQPELQAYFGSCFERLCREALPALYAATGVTAAFHVGEYWDKNTQIDVVGIRDDNWTDLGECKWGGSHSGAALERELEEKISHYPNPGHTTIGRHVFTRTKRRPNTRQSLVAWHSLEDLYE